MKLFGFFKQFDESPVVGKKFMLIELENILNTIFI